MRLDRLNLLVCFTILAIGARAETITGTILIKKRLTRPSVTPAVSVYQRGTTVELGADEERDPIAYERSRVILYLEGPAPAPIDLTVTPSDSYQIKQIDRRFLPDLIVVPVGSTVSFPNMDPIFHNVFSLSRPRTFDLGSYDRGQTRRVRFPKPGIVDVYCHLHPNMEATIVVTPNRWYAQPDRAGRYQISGVPHGEYTLVAWHKSAGFFRRRIVVQAGHDTVADFFIPIEERTR
ncbi:MAG: carboxypeptidase regulatory-like domain-containing protein [Terracidiphilus sp.]